jgi:hypothetical protein
MNGEMKRLALAALLAALGLALAGCAGGGGKPSLTGMASMKAGRFVATTVHRLTATSGCVSVRWRLRTAAGRGQSVVEAVGLLAPHPRRVGGTPFWRMRLTHVRTLSGKSWARSFPGWIQATSYPAASAADAPGLWARDGHLVAIVTPRRVARTRLGPLLSTAPLVGTRVILSAASCWADKSLPTTRFTGRLREIPGSNAYALAKRAGGFGALPLRRFLRLLHS